MKFWLKVFYTGLSICCFAPFVANGAALSGSVMTHQSSDTAANAKTKAMSVAMRQVMFDAVSKYTDSNALRDLLENTKDNDLVNFVVSSSVSNEQISATDYSAKITVVLNNVALKNWLNQNEIQNWIPVVESGEQFLISVVLPNGITDWAELKQIAREDGFEIETKTIAGNNVIAKLPLSYRTKFTIAVRSAGWKFTDNNGVLQIWK